MAGMSAIQFVGKYKKYVNEIKLICKPKYYNIIADMRKTDPHDLVSPETWFGSEIAAAGYVWSIFLREVAKRKK